MLNNDLYHHGILGMKWGVRRYQNEDGSRTNEGLEHLRDTRHDYTPKQSSSLNSDTVDLLKKSVPIVGATIGVTIGSKYLSGHKKDISNAILQKVANVSMRDIVSTGSKAVNVGSKVAKAYWNFGIGTVKTGGKIARTGAKIIKSAV